MAYPDNSSDTEFENVQPEDEQEADLANEGAQAPAADIPRPTAAPLQTDLQVPATDIPRPTAAPLQADLEFDKICKELFEPTPSSPKKKKAKDWTKEGRRPYMGRAKAAASSSSSTASGTKSTASEAPIGAAPVGKAIHKMPIGAGIIKTANNTLGATYDPTVQAATGAGRSRVFMARQEAKHASVQK
jgi:hypothetical protein